MGPAAEVAQDSYLVKAAGLPAVLVVAKEAAQAGVVAEEECLPVGEDWAVKP